MLRVLPCVRSRLVKDDLDDLGLSGLEKTKVIARRDAVWTAGSPRRDARADPRA